MSFDFFYFHAPLRFLCSLFSVWIAGSHKHLIFFIIVLFINIYSDCHHYYCSITKKSRHNFSWYPLLSSLDIQFFYNHFQVKYQVNHKLLRITLFFLFWSGHEMDALLFIGWLRAILFFVPLKRKEYVLAAGHYKVVLFLLLFYLFFLLLL